VVSPATAVSAPDQCYGAPDRAQFQRRGSCVLRPASPTRAPLPDRDRCPLAAPQDRTAASRGRISSDPASEPRTTAFAAAGLVGWTQRLGPQARPLPGYCRHDHLWRTGSGLAAPAVPAGNHAELRHLLSRWLGGRAADL